MCIGLPMQVQQAAAGRAWVLGRGERREVETLLIGEVQPGDWLLVFLDSARERISAARAAEVDETLDLLALVMGGGSDGGGVAGFVLPSSMNHEQLAALAGLPEKTA
jgi:hydrogenase expression/formation protein HypC